MTSQKQGNEQGQDESICDGDADGDDSHCKAAGDDVQEADGELCECGLEEPKDPQSAISRQ